METLEQTIRETHDWAVDRIHTLYPGSNVEAGLARRRKAEGEAWKKG